MKSLDLITPAIIFTACWFYLSGMLRDSIMAAYFTRDFDAVFWSGMLAVIVMAFSIWVSDGVEWAIGCVKSLWTRDHE